MPATEFACIGIGLIAMAVAVAVAVQICANFADSADVAGCSSITSDMSHQCCRHWPQWPAVVRSVNCY